MTCSATQILTERQLQVLNAFAKGLRVTQIAYELQITEAAVAKHTLAIRKKLKASTMPQAMWNYAKMRHCLGRELEFTLT